jgi:protocatechuate 3,4-dioxygenase, beta subunit
MAALSSIHHSMQDKQSNPNRRNFIGGALGLVGAELFTTRGLFAQRLADTPALTEGPFYPDHLPLDTDNDLLILNGQITPASGQVTRVSGRILTAAGSPVNGVTIEIWQVDNNGVYINSRSPNKNLRDPNFQGFGRFITASAGEYTFRTIKPVPYDNRCPHIHVKVKKGDRELLTTQIFVQGHPMNPRDGVLRELRDPFDRELVTAELKPVADSPTGELSAHFDIVLGHTPDERTFLRKAGQNS